MLGHHNDWPERDQPLHDSVDVLESAALSPCHYCGDSYQLDRAQELLGDFAIFWRAKPDPAERRKLLSSLFDHIWQDTGRIVAVTSRPAFAVYFKTIDQARPTRPKGRPKGGVTKAGATGVQPSFGTTSRSAREARRLIALDQALQQ